MNSEMKSNWVRALRLGEYTQGFGFLCKDGKYCAEGVFKALYGVNDAEGSVCSGESFKKSGLTPRELQEIALRNDVLHQPFSEIANWIETHIPG